MRYGEMESMTIEGIQPVISRTDFIEQRRETRITLQVVLQLRRSSNSAGYRREVVTENVSRKGARVICDLPLPVGAEVKVSAFGGKFKASAVVCHVEGGDGLWLIGLEFKKVLGKWIVS